MTSRSTSEFAFVISSLLNGFGWPSSESMEGILVHGGQLVTRCCLACGGWNDGHAEWCPIATVNGESDGG